MKDNALSIKEVARFFNVCPRTIREWMKKDDNFPKPFKKFGTLRFERQLVERYWAANRLEDETEK